MRENKRVPLVAMRGKVILPGKTDHFEISRKKSMAAVEAAMMRNEDVFLVAQRNTEEVHPGADGLYEYGTLCSVRQLARLPQDMGRAMVEGKRRCRLKVLWPEKDMLTAEVEPEDLIETDPDAPVSEAMLRVMRSRLSEYGKLDRQFAEKYLDQLLRIQNVNRLLTRTAADLPWDWSVCQRFLECDTAEELYESLVAALTKEIEIGEIRRDFQQKLRDHMNKNQKEYVLREQMKLIQEELGGDAPLTDAEEYEERVGKLEASDEVKEKIRKEIARLKLMPGGSQEGNVLRTYLETLLDLPWDHCSKDNEDLAKAEQILEEDHYGLAKVKERVVEYLAVRMLNPEQKGAILCLVGPPGTGKTSIAKSIARALDRKYVRMSLGGVRDEAEIRGHRKTYVGAMPGRIVDALRQAGTANPLILLDEVDKLSSEYHGATSSALLEVLDGEQNVRFRDHYVELPIDLSKVLFIATANTTETIPAPLLDRMEMIELNSYTENEKMHIAEDYLLKKQAKANGIKEGQVEITEKALQKLIRNYTREAGVRNAERRIGDIYRKCAREILKGRKRKIVVTDKQLPKYLGKEKVHYQDAAKTDEAGIVRGLAWTRVGGDTLEIEVNIMPGKGGLILTGQMGDVMKESARIALSCVRAEGPKWNIPDDFFEKNEIHLHIPEGAVPKDGPSAGTAMAVAILSAAANIKVRCDTAMTGEITLRGRVLPVGGLKEKILAARMAKLKKVLVPAANRPDIEELSKEITGGLKIVYIERFEEALKEALV
ncbi:MAG: endopeptidase La [Stomatobaculum sp.]|nr:endopeptidase La [Stomatobaculum sp.]